MNNDLKAVNFFKVNNVNDLPFLFCVTIIFFLEYTKITIVIRNIMQIIKDVTIKDTLYYGSIPVFVYQIIYPFFTTTCSSLSAQKINNYYALAAKKIEKYCHSVLYPQAVERARYIPTNNPPFNSYTLYTNYNVTYNNKCITSLYMDTYTYMGGAHGETNRVSNTWNFSTGTKLFLKDIYPLNITTFKGLQLAIGQQIQERLKVNSGSYFDDYKSLLQNSLNLNNFYIQPNNLVIYYQQYDIAPYSTGIPEFYLPLRLG